MPRHHLVQRPGIAQGALALALAAAACGCSAIPSPRRTASFAPDAAPSPRPARRRVSAAVFHRGVLWVRGADGSLAAVDIARDTVSYQLATERVIDVHRTIDDKLWVLSATDLDVHLWERQDGGFKPLIEMAAPSSPMLAVSDLRGRPVLLAERAVFFADASGTLTTTTLSQQVKLGYVPHIAFAVAATGAAYVGTNNGEWGGALYHIPLSSGQVQLVQRIDGKELCSGPLNPNCDPVTSLIPDPSAPSCVLAGVGLRHFMESGRLLKVCGTTVNLVPLKETKAPPAHVGPELTLAVFFGETVESPPVQKAPKPPPSEEGDAPAEESQEGQDLGGICQIDPSACPKVELPKPPEDTPGASAVFGLSRTRRGYWMVTGQSLFFVQGDHATRVDKPLLERHGGVMLGWTPGALTLVTDANWAASLSGYTPLVAATSLEGAAAADDLAQHPALQRLVSGSPVGTCWFMERDEEQSRIQRAPPAAKALCFDADRFFAKGDRGWISGPVRWRRSVDMVWIADLSAQESVRLRVGKDHALAAYSPSPAHRKTRLRRASDVELGSLREELRAVPR